MMWKCRPSLVIYMRYKQKKIAYQYLDRNNDCPVFFEKKVRTKKKPDNYCFGSQTYFFVFFSVSILGIKRKNCRFTNSITHVRSDCSTRTSYLNQSWFTTFSNVDFTTMVWLLEEMDFLNLIRTSVCGTITAQEAVFCIEQIFWRILPRNFAGKQLDKVICKRRQICLHCSSLVRTKSVKRVKEVLHF